MQHNPKKDRLTRVISRTAEVLTLERLTNDYYQWAEITTPTHADFGALYSLAIAERAMKNESAGARQHAYSDQTFIQ